jgi:N-acetylglucosaminyl-diphospho-decaprenol L-rhamnosyltransferase
LLDQDVPHDKPAKYHQTLTRIGVVVVTFRSGRRAGQALDALARSSEQIEAAHELTLVVVDNASRDGTRDLVLEQAPLAELIEQPRNVGFAAACNAGIERCREREVDLIVLLNPDVEVREDFLARLAGLHWSPEIAARGPAILDDQGQLEQSARGFPRARTGLLGRTSLLARLRPSSRLLRGDLLADIDGGARRVDWVSGACLIAPSERFRSIGSLDEGYFMYWEDADWCWRASQMGYIVVYDPALVVVHHQGSSSQSRPFASTIAFHRSALRYWRTNAARTPASTIAAAVALTLRCAVKLAVLAAQRSTAREAASKGRP